MKTLYMTIKKEWFEKIKSGQKQIEFREIKPYWTTRLQHDDGSFKNFEQICFINGYSKHSPRFCIEHIKTEFFNNKNDLNLNIPVYAIYLGKVID
jgi:hypothetical protein